jgi:hypothetical protein
MSAEHQGRIYHSRNDQIGHPSTLLSRQRIPCIIGISPALLKEHHRLFRVTFLPSAIQSSSELVDLLLQRHTVSSPLPGNIWKLCDVRTMDGCRGDGATWKKYVWRSGGGRNPPWGKGVVRCVWELWRRSLRGVKRDEWSKAQ